MDKDLQRIIYKRERSVASKALKVYGWLKIIVSPIGFVFLLVTLFGGSEFKLYKNMFIIFGLLGTLESILVGMILISISGLLDDVKQNNHYLKYLVRSQYYQSHNIGK